MNTYEVIDPQSGVTLELTGDSPPTEQELEEIFSQYSAPQQSEQAEAQEPQDKSLLEQAHDTTFQFGKGMHDAVSSTLGIPFDASEMVINLGIQAYNKATGSDVKPLSGSLGTSENLKSIVPDVEPEGTAENIARIGGQVIPAIAGGVAAAKQLPATATKLGSLAQASGVGAAEGLILSESDDTEGKLRDAAIGAVAAPALAGSAMFVNSRLAKSGMVQKFVENNPTSRFAEHINKVTARGEQLAANRNVQNVVKQGVDEGVAGVVSNASKTDKRKMLQMLQVLKRSKADKRFSATNRPSDVIGRSVMERFNVVNQANRKAARQLDSVAKGLKGQNIDISEAIEGFTDDLADMGVTLKDDSLVPDFKNSDIDGVRGAQIAVKQMLTRMKNANLNDAYDIHRIKKFIDETVTYGKNKHGLAGSAERLLKKLRHNLDSSLDGTFPKYNQVNTDYAETRAAIDALQDAAGKKIDLTSNNAEKAIGTLSRRVLSNAQSRAQVMDMLETVQDTAIQHGGKFDDDIITQVIFADELDTVFGPAARTSLAGETEKAARQAGRLRDKQGVTDLLLTGAGKGVDKIRNINDEGAIKALQELLK